MKIGSLVLVVSLLFFSCRNVEYKGVIIDKVYTPSSSGTGISTSGNVVFVSNPETYTIVYKGINGIVSTERIDQSGYYKLKIGDSIIYTRLERNY